MSPHCPRQQIKIPSSSLQRPEPILCLLPCSAALLHCVSRLPEKDHLGHLVNTQKGPELRSPGWGSDITLCICFFVNPLGFLSFKDFYARNSQMKFKVHLGEYFPPESLHRLAKKFI